VLNVRKSRGSDMDRCINGDQATHFFGWMENLNVVNFICDCKVASTTLETWPTLCISSAYEGKTQVGWVVAKG
jgi:hypothetical protein